MTITHTHQCTTSKYLSKLYLVIPQNLPQIQLESNLFPGGSHLVLGLADGTSLSLQIIKPFLPFTKSQFFLVCPGHGNGLPSELILKVYDPCYLDDRIPPPKSNLPSRLWTLKAETRPKQHIIDRKLRKENVQMISR